jgi:hypothetical protein
MDTSLLTYWWQFWLSFTKRKFMGKSF